MKRKIHFRENWLIFLGIWGEAELILRIWGAKENTFRELRNFLSGIWDDQCILFRDKGSTDPPLGASNLFLACMYLEILSEYDQDISQTAEKNHDTARKNHTTITRHQEDKLSKAISSLFPIKIIANLEWT